MRYFLFVALVLVAFLPAEARRHRYYHHRSQVCRYCDLPENDQAESSHLNGYVEDLVLRSVRTPDGLSLNAMRRAFRWYAQHYNELTNKRYITIADYSLPSNEDRLFVLDLANGTYRRYSVAHGSGSGLGLTPVRFSNRYGSHMTSLGAYVTGELYEYGRKMKLYGKDPTNDNAFARGIIMHSSWYANRGHVGHSWGCLSMPPREFNEIKHHISGGSLVYVYSDVGFGEGRNDPVSI